MMHLRTTKWVVKEYIAGKLKEAKMAQLKKKQKKGKGKKKRKENIEQANQIKVNNKMEDLRLNISAITLNVKQKNSKKNCQSK